MSEATPLNTLLELARRHTRGEASPRRHQASRARVLDQLGQRRSKVSSTFAVVGFVVLGTAGAGAFAGVKSYRYSNGGIEYPPPPIPTAPAERHSASTPSSDVDKAPSNENGEGVKLQVMPEYATVYWDDKKLEGAAPSIRMKPDHKMHKVRAEAPGHVSKTQLVQLDEPFVLIEMELAALPITMGPISSSSSVIDADEIGSGLKDAFQACYVGALDETPTLSGKATVFLQMKENGKVDSVDIIDKEGLNPSVTTCLASCAADIHFRVTGAGFVKIPLVFRTK